MDAERRRLRRAGEERHRHMITVALRRDIDPPNHLRVELPGTVGK
jgi:hypothetical protein